VCWSTPSGHRQRADNIILIGPPIDDVLANVVIAQILFPEAEDPDRDVLLYINSPGGSVTAGLAIYDTMQFVRPDVQSTPAIFPLPLGGALPQKRARTMALSSWEPSDWPKTSALGSAVRQPILAFEP